MGDGITGVGSKGWDQRMGSWGWDNGGWDHGGWDHGDEILGCDQGDGIIGMGS